MTIIANHDLAADVRAVCNRLGEARFQVTSSKASSGILRVKLAAFQAKTTAAEVWIDTDDGQLLSVYLPAARQADVQEAGGADKALALLATLVPETAEEAKPATAAAPRRKAKPVAARTSAKKN